MRKSLFIITALVLGALILTTPKSISAADNMCNVNLNCGSDPEKWVAGWYEAREPEKVNAAPQQTEWTNASQPEPEVIRVANEDNSVNRSQIAADDAAARGGDPVNPSTVTETTPPPGGCPSGTIADGVTCKLDTAATTAPTTAPTTASVGGGTCPEGLVDACNLAGDRAPGGSFACTNPVNNKVMNCCPSGTHRDSMDANTNNCVSDSGAAPTGGLVKYCSGQPNGTACKNSSGQCGTCITSGTTSACTNLTTCPAANAMLCSGVGEDCTTYQRTDTTNCKKAVDAEPLWWCKSTISSPPSSSTDCSSTSGSGCLGKNVGNPCGSSGNFCTQTGTSAVGNLPVCTCSPAATISAPATAIAGGTGGGGTGGTGGIMTPSANLTPVPPSTSGGEGTCTAGPNHEYNECCGEGKSRKVIRSCNNSGGFVYAVGACDQSDGACGNVNASTGTSCPSGQAYVNGKCYSSGSCNPYCPATSTCGQADGCSGVCTNKCGSQVEANTVSAVGPTAGPNGGIINGGNSDSNACNASTGVCQAGGGQTLQQCNCSGLSNNQGSTGVCIQNCRPVGGSVNCQTEANSSCQAVQLDVLDGSGKVVDTIVCLPPSGCSGGAPVTGGVTTMAGGSAPAAGGGEPAVGGGTQSPTGTVPPGGTAGACVATRLYINSSPTPATPAQIAALRIGDTIRLAVKGNLASFTKGRFVIKLNNSVLATQETTTKQNLPGDPATFEFIYDHTITQGGNYSIEGSIWQ